MGRICWSLDEVNEDVLAFTIGYDYSYSCLLDFLRSGIFRMHAPTSEGALLGFDVL